MRAARPSRGWLWFAVVVPSSFIVHKYAGWTCTLTYAVGVAAILAVIPDVIGVLARRSSPRLAVLAFGALCALFAVGYPIANTHAPRSGSDDDDAINAAVTAMLHGHSPYSVTTYLGNRVHHLPGALILAAPFVVIGTSALQNLCWIPLFFAAAARDADRRRAAALALLVLALSPAVAYEVVSGTGYAANAISVVLGLWLLIRDRGSLRAAVAWGITLASRANFLLLLPLAFGYERQHEGASAARRALLGACFAAAALVVPFYLHDPAHFSPLEGADRLLVFDGMFPHLGAVLMVAMGGLAVALAATPMDRADLFFRAAIVQAFPIVAAIVLSSVRDRTIDLAYARYGGFFAWFALFGIAAAGERRPAAAGAFDRSPPRQASSVQIE